jgi:hypothetical protein
MRQYVENSKNKYFPYHQKWVAMEKNIPLIRKTWEYITEHPEEHNQKDWARQTTCGTTYCFAGTALVLSNYDFDFGEAKPDRFDFGEANPVHRSAYVVKSPEGKLVSIGGSAEQELGLTYEEANKLFLDCHTLADVGDMLYSLTNGEVGNPLWAGAAPVVVVW